MFTCGKRITYLFFKRKMEAFYRNEMYREPQYMKQVFRNHVGNSSWLIHILPPHAPWVPVAPSFLVYPGEMLGTP